MVALKFIAGCVFYYPLVFQRLSVHKELKIKLSDPRWAGPINPLLAQNVESIDISIYRASDEKIFEFLYDKDGRSNKKYANLHLENENILFPGKFVQVSGIRTRYITQCFVTTSPDTK